MRLAVLLLLSTLAVSQTSQKDSEFITKTLYPATTLLYAQDENGGMKMACTATAIEKIATGLIFTTAAHCVCDDSTIDRTASPKRTGLYVTADEKNNKTFIKAKLLGCGYRTRGDDIALLQVDTTKSFPVIPLGHDPVDLERVVNVASPLGLGKQVFLGSISSADLDRPLFDEETGINWNGVVLVQMFGVDGGSSGSSVVCIDQKAICGIIVGTLNKTTITALPVSRILKFKENLAAGTYKNWDPDPDSPVLKKK